MAEISVAELEDLERKLDALDLTENQRELLSALAGADPDDGEVEGFRQPGIGRPQGVIHIIFAEVGGPQGPDDIIGFAKGPDGGLAFSRRS